VRADLGQDAFGVCALKAQIERPAAAHALLETELVGGTPGARQADKRVERSRL